MKRELFPMMSRPECALGGIFLLFLLFCLVYSCSRTDEDGDRETGAGNGDMPEHHAFVGGETCQSCHAQEWEEWKGSHHDYAIEEADEQSVLGDFNNTEFTDGDDTYRFYREEDTYRVEITGPDGETETHRVDYTFGWEPLQQYLTDTGQGKFQAFHVAWDTVEEKWYSLYPDESFEEEDWMHWKGGSMNWNTMCADCHSTNLRENYIAEADSFHTTWSVIDVSCEACHGPGEQHAAFMNSPESEEASTERIRQDLNLGGNRSQIEEINTCAPCHSLREKLTDSYVHGEEYLDHFDPQLIHPDNYFADGQIRGEVYVYGSFLQSRMYGEGIQCTDCHNPHTLELKEPLVNNQLCMQCHEPEYNTPGHHFHQANTEGSQCVNCHMTGRTYMGNDYRRDHSFRIPRPDQSAVYGTPNACNDCHTDRSPGWASEAIENWYGEERTPHFSDVLLKADAGEEDAVPGLKELIADTSQPELIRATAVWYIGRFPDEETADVLTEAVRSDSPLVRNSAAKAMENLPADVRKPVLETLLDDEVRAVRVAAARHLSEYAVHDFRPDFRDPFNNAMEEYREYLEVNQYFPQGQMNMARYYEQQGDTEKAVEAYHKTLERDPYFQPARINLAYIYNSLGQNDRAEDLLTTVTEQEPDYGDAFYSLGLLLAEENRLEEAAERFEQAAEHMPEHSRLFYNLAIARQTLGQPERAENAYKRAIELEPENGDFHYGIVTLYMQQEQYEKALEHAEILDRIHPDNPQVQQLVRTILQEIDE